MAGTDAAKQRKVLEAAFQLALKLPYRGAASPIKPILALDAETGEFHREPCFLGKGITFKAQFTYFPAECQCLSAESVPLLVKRRIGGKSSDCRGNPLL